MRKNPDARFHTAAVTPGRYFEVFERAAQEGLPTIYMGLPAGQITCIAGANGAGKSASSPSNTVLSP